MLRLLSPLDYSEAIPPNASSSPLTECLPPTSVVYMARNHVRGSCKTSQVNGQRPPLPICPLHAECSSLFGGSGATGPEQSSFPSSSSRDGKTPCYGAPFFLLFGITSSGSSPFLKAAIKSCILPSTLSSNLQQASSTPMPPSSHISSTLRTIFCRTPT